MNTGTVYLLVIVATAFWGGNFVLAGPVMADLPPLWAAALRFVIGAGAMYALALWRREPLLAPFRHRPGAYLLLGLIGIGGFNLLFFYALQSTSSTNAALIMATNPLLTTLIAALILGERPSGRQIAALPLALIGVVVVISGGSLARIAALEVADGDLLMLGADLVWALYNVLARRYMPAASPISNTTLMMGAGALMLLSVAVIDGGRFNLPSGTASAALLLMALGGTVLAYLFWNTGIAHLGAGRTSLFLNLVPVFAMLSAATVGALPTHIQLTGGVLVICGVTIAMMPKRGVALV
ncbi:MAG: DMT family transporter [Candidatus Thiodiazotropha sp.]